MTWEGFALGFVVGSVFIFVMWNIAENIARRSK